MHRLRGAYGFFEASRKTPIAVEVLLPERLVRRHHGVAELARVRDVAHEVVDAAVLGPDLGQVGRAEVRRAGAAIRVAVEAAGLRHELAAELDCSSVAPSARFASMLALGDPRLDHLAAGLGALLRGRALVRQHAHRDDHEDPRHERDGPPADAALAPPVEEREREQQNERDRRDPDRAEDDRLRPLEDPQQVEEEEEEPVGPRDEARRPRVGLLGVPRAEHADVRRVLAGVEVPDARRARSITATTTSDITVSCHIANGKNGFPRDSTSSL